MANAKNKVRAAAGKIGGHRLHALHDSGEIAAKAREGFDRRFEFEVDPEGILPESERLRRADQARKAHMARLAMKSAQARASRRGSHA